MNPDDSKQMDAMLSEHDDNTRRLEALMRDGPALPPPKPNQHSTLAALREAHGTAASVAVQLRKALSASTAVEAIVLLPLIASATHQMQQIGALYVAIAEARRP